MLITAISQHCACMPSRTSEFLRCFFCISYVKQFLPRDAMNKRGLCRHGVCVCLCVCVSVTFVHCVKTNKDIFNFFSPSGSHTILVFPHQTGLQYYDGNPPNGASNAGRVGRNRDSEPLSGLTTCVNAATGRCSKRGRVAGGARPACRKL